MRLWNQNRFGTVKSQRVRSNPHAHCVAGNVLPVTPTLVVHTLDGGLPTCVTHTASSPPELRSMVVASSTAVPSASSYTALLPAEAHVPVLRVKQVSRVSAATAWDCQRRCPQHAGAQALKQRCYLKPCVTHRETMVAMRPKAALRSSARWCRRTEQAKPTDEQRIQ